MDKKNYRCCFTTASRASRCFLKAFRPRSVILYLVFGLRSTNDFETDKYFSRSSALILRSKIAIGNAQHFLQGIEFIPIVGNQYGHDLQSYAMFKHFI